MRWSVRDNLWLVTSVALLLAVINLYTQKIWLLDSLDDAKQRQKIYIWELDTRPTYGLPKVSLPQCADDWCEQCDGCGVIIWDGHYEECPSCLGVGYPNVG